MTKILKSQLSQDSTLNQEFISRSMRDQSQNKSVGANYVRTISGGQSIFSGIFFTWLHPFIKESYKNGVKIQQLPSLPQKLTTQNSCQKMQNIWLHVQKSQRAGLTLIKTIFKTFKSQILKLFLLFLINDFLYILYPILTASNINYIQDYDPNDQNYHTYGIILFCSTLFIDFLYKTTTGQYLWTFRNFGINIKNNLNMMIYCKALKYSSLADKNFSQSQIINYSQVDSERMTGFGFHLSALIYGPIQIIFSFFMMYYYIGLSCLSGIGLILLMLIINHFFIKKQDFYNDQVMKSKDQRMKITSQMLNIIRFIKITTIQKYFFNKIQEKRSIQLHYYFKKGLYNVITLFIFWLTTPILLSATFMTYVFMGFKISPEIAFTIMSLGTLIQDPIQSFPQAISQLIQIMNSIKRIQKFLLTSQINNNHMSYKQQSQYAITIEKGNFLWQKQKQTQKKDQQQLQQIKRDEQQQQDKKTEKNEKEFLHALKNIDLRIRKGHLVMVIGEIGSGKTSLLLSILNEMFCNQGAHIQISGSIAYSSQKPWIMPKTVKENILFSLPYDQEKFKKIIYLSSLQQDLNMLPQKQQTQIGQKGVNLSGGQKARLSFARALYSQRDIYLLDDILSAVDVHVGQFLMRQAIKTFLKDKTILMPTHAIKYLKYADEIIILKKGQIIKQGAFNDIINSPQYKQILQVQTQHQIQQQKTNQQKDNQEAQKTMISDAMRIRKISSQQKDIAPTPDKNDRIIEQLILSEDKQTGHVNYNIFMKFIEYSGGKFNFLTLVVITLCISIILMALGAIFIEKWCQNADGDNMELYYYIICILISNIFVLLHAIISLKSGLKQGKTVHTYMIKSLIYASLSKFFNRIPLGRIVNRITKDLRQIDQQIMDAVGWVLYDLFSLLSVLFICIYASTPYAIIPMTIAAILSYIVRKYFIKLQRQLARFQKITNSPVVSGVMLTIEGLSSIRAYKQQNNFTDQQFKNIDKNKQISININGLQNWFNNSLNFICFLIHVPCIAFCMFLGDKTNPSLIGLLMVYSISLSDYVAGLTFATSHFETKLISMERVYTFINVDPQKGYQNYCEQWVEEEEGAKQVIPSGQINFINLRAKYRQGLPNVLNGLTFKIKAGQKIGIVGRTGAGKTSIINTLLKITQISNGSILIDGKNIEEYPLKDLRHSITMIDQQPTLIKSSFRQNLDLTNKYKDQQIQNILKQCNLYQTIVSKGGLMGAVSNSSLSAGQKQLLCICRAFLKNSKIILIDEATANIDMKNDNLIQKIIQQKFKESTVITIAHRLSTLKNCDKILVLEKGQLVEFGSLAQLQNNGGFFSQMLKSSNKQIFV